MHVYRQASKDGHIHIHTRTYTARETETDNLCIYTYRQKTDNKCKEESSRHKRRAKCISSRVIQLMFFFLAQFNHSLEFLSPKFFVLRFQDFFSSLSLSVFKFSSGFLPPKFLVSLTSLRLDCITFAIALRSGPPQHVHQGIVMGPVCVCVCPVCA